MDGGDGSGEGGSGENEAVSEGLAYALNDDGAGYTVTGIGECTDTELVIPAMYNGLPVTSIGYWAFAYCSSLTICCEASEQPSGWDSSWNCLDYSGNYVSVVWGYKPEEV